MNNKTSEHVAQQFENVWLLRYPQPNKCVHDQGTEFLGGSFQRKLQQHGIIDRPTTSRNPQANSICERMHHTVANVLRTTNKLRRPKSLFDAIQQIEDAIATTVYATRVSVSRSLGALPGNLMYGRDMFLDLPFQADLITLQDK